jgi:agmatinase
VSFFRPPRTFLGISPAEYPLERSFAALLPIPYDATTSYRPGARFGPQAIIDASLELETYDEELGAETAALGIYTLQPVEVDLRDAAATLERVRAVAAGLASGERLLVGLGGEHSVTVGLVEGLRGLYPDLHVLYLDAHADFRDHYQGTPYSHACGLRRIWEKGCPAAAVGVRSLSREEREALERGGPWVLPASVFQPAVPSLEPLLERLGEPLYISIDLDVLDPGVMPAVGTPEPGGLGWYELLAVLRAVSERYRIVGFDVMELCPEAGPPYAAFVAAKLTYRLIGYAARSWGLLPAAR